MSIAACGGASTTAPTAAPHRWFPPSPPPLRPPRRTTAPAEPVTLNIWHHWGPDDAKGPALQSIFKDFMAANPNITIKDSVYVDADIPLKVETASAAKQEPDLVFSVEFGSVFNWADSGIAVPVNDYIKQWGLDGKFKDVALSNYTQCRRQDPGLPPGGLYLADLVQHQGPAGRRCWHPQDHR